MSDLNSLVAATSATLERIARDFSPAVFASSLAAEDMVLTDLILKAGLPIGIFSLDTGRLHPETLAVVDAVKARYDYAITLYHPNAAGGRRVRRRERPERLLRQRRDAPRLLRHPQGRAARPRPGRQQGLGHRPAPRPVHHPRRTGGRGRRSRRTA